MLAKLRAFAFALGLIAARGAVKPALKQVAEDVRQLAADVVKLRADLAAVKARVDGSTPPPAGPPKDSFVSRR